MNNLSMVGRLTKDVELRYLKTTGTAVARFSIAVKRLPSVGTQPAADFFSVVVFGKLGEHAANYLRKGQRVSLTGKLRNNNYVGDDGVKRYFVEILANTIEFIDWDNDKKPHEDDIEMENDIDVAGENKNEIPDNLGDITENYEDNPF